MEGSRRRSGAEDCAPIGIAAANENSSTQSWLRRKHDEHGFGMATPYRKSDWTKRQDCTSDVLLQRSKKPKRDSATKTTRSNTIPRFARNEVHAPAKKAGHRPSETATAADEQVANCFRIRSRAKRTSSSIKASGVAALQGEPARLNR